MLAVVGKVLDGATILIRAISLVESGADICEVLQNKKLSSNEKAIRCVANGVFILAEGGALGSWGFGRAPSCRLKWEVAAGAADIGRRGIQLVCKRGIISSDEKLDFVGMVAFRVSNVMGQTLSLRPTLLQDHENTARGIVEIIRSIGECILQRKPIANVTIRGWNFLQAVGAYLLKKDPSGSSMETKIQKKHQALRVSPRYMGKVLKVRNALNIRTFSKIPEIFCDDSFLRKFKCSLTKKPIRYILMVAGTPPSPVYYEKEVVLKHLSSKDTPPPGWPKKIPLTRKNLLESPHEQKRIDDRLQLLLKEAQEFNLEEILEGEPHANREQIRPSPRDLAKSLQMNNPFLLDADLRDKISHILSPDTYTSIAVRILDYEFPEEVRPRKARQITLKPRPCDYFRLSFNRDPINPSRVTSAILGSEDPEDKRHLATASRIHSTIHITFSFDLQYIHFDLIKPMQNCVVM